MPVIGIHPSGVTQNKVQNFVTSSGLKYPIFLANEEEGGLTAGYPTTIFPYAVYIDATGKVADHGFLNDLEKRISEKQKRNKGR